MEKRWSRSTSFEDFGTNALMFLLLRHLTVRKWIDRLVEASQ